jgi:hypothetical protein
MTDLLYVITNAKPGMSNLWPAGHLRPNSFLNYTWCVAPEVPILMNFKFQMHVK